MSLNSLHTGSAAASDSQRARLLKSLEYKLINKRRANVKGSYDETFRWIFGPTKTTREDKIDMDKHIPYECEGDNTGGSDLESYDQWGSEPWDSLSDWLKSESDTYWISGKAGSGKSCLMKFIESSPETRKALEIWAPNTTILSHYFWKPGPMMQKSIKGMICSLLHQALSRSPEALDLTLSTFSGVVGSKEAVADWSVEELRSICMATLGRYPQAICVLIDGLDELCDEDDQPELLEIIDKLSTNQNIKVCVASRAEPLLKDHLSRHPHLKLEDLTAKDMSQYAKAQLLPVFSVRHIDPETQKMIIWHLVHKAQGVFLWLHLVVRRLRDSEPEEGLLQYLERLPCDLLELYRDIWNNTAATRYLNFVISNKRLMDTSWETFANHYVNDMIGDNMSVLHMVATTDEAIQRALLEDQDSPPRHLRDQIQEACEKTEKDIEAQCAGLLEMTSVPKNELSVFKMTIDRLSAPVTFSGIVSLAYRKIQFIHRSAYDFLTDTSEGLQIRDCDPTSEDERWLSITKGYLGLAQTGKLGTMGHINRALEPLSCLAVPKLQPEIDRVLAICQRWYRRRVLRLLPGLPSWSPKGRPDRLSPPFLVLAAYPKFRDFVISAIARSPDPSLEATILLRHLSDRRARISENVISNVYCYLRPLLRLGADPNKKDIIRHDRYSRELCRGAINFDSAFGRFLNVAVQRYNHHWETPLSVVEAVVRSFMSTEPNLDDRTSIGVKICTRRNGTRGTRHTPMANDPDYFEVISNIPNLSDNIWDHVCFILSVNLAFLLDVLNKRTRKFFGQNTSVSTSINPSFPTSQVQPHAQVRFVLLMNGYTRKRYRLVDENVYPDLVRIIEQWLQGNNSEPVFSSIDRVVENVLSEISDNTRYQEVDSMLPFLAEEQCGYTKVSNTELADLVKIVE